MGCIELEEIDGRLNGEKNETFVKSFIFFSFFRCMCRRCLNNRFLNSLVNREFLVDWYYFHCYLHEL